MKTAGNTYNNANPYVAEYLKAVCDELGEKLERMRANPAYAGQIDMIDRMVMEKKLFPGGFYDTDPGRQDEIEDLMLDMCKDALEDALDSTEWYVKAADQVKNNMREFFGGRSKSKRKIDNGYDISTDRSFCFPEPGSYGILEPEDRKEEFHGSGLLGYGSIKTGLSTSLRKDLEDSSVTAYAKVRKLKCLGLFDADEAKFQIGTKDGGNLKASLMRVISKQLYSGAKVKVKDFEDPRVTLSTGLTWADKTGVLSLGGGFELRAPKGERKAKPYLTFVFSKKF